MQAEFIKGIRGTDPILNDGHKQVAFIGRSNVGKSSVINSLLGTKYLVRSSSTPGQTQEINFFLVNGKSELSHFSADQGAAEHRKRSVHDRYVSEERTSQRRNVQNEEVSEMYFVDLPGYGYAKMSRKSREKMAKMILWYLTESGADISTVALILDAQRGVTDFDRDMLEVLRVNRHRTVVIANKSDKLNQKERVEAKRNIQAELDKEELVMYSAKKAKEKDVLFENLLKE